MNRKDRKSRVRRFSSLCLTIIMLLSAFCADTYASVVLELPSGAESAGTISGVNEGSVEIPEDAAANGQKSESKDKSSAADRQDDLEELVQTQEGLEYAIEKGLVTFERPGSDVSAASTKMGSRAEIVQVAKNQVGIKGRPNKFTYWYGPISGYSNPYAYAWCQVFASWCGCQAGVDVPVTASCYYGGQWFKERGLWRNRSSYKPKAGDYIYFDWNANGGWDHVGIVNYVSDGRVYTIEGNTSDMVKASKSYSLTDTEIIGYGTPKYVDGGEQNNMPMGCFDEVLPEKGTNKVRFRGWSFDWDDPSKIVQIHIYVGGKAGSGAPGYVAAADSFRPDVDDAYPGCGQYHGFDVTLDVPVDRTKKQTVYAYAIDAGGLGNPLLGSKALSADKTIAENEGGDQQTDVIPGPSQDGQSPETTPEPMVTATPEPTATAAPTATPTPTTTATPKPTATATPKPTATPVTVGKVEKPVLKQIAYNQFRLSWNAVKGADSYEVQYAPDKKFSKPLILTTGKTNAAVKVACGSMRYFRVRASRTVNKTKYYGKYSATIKDKTVLGTTKLTSCSSKKKKKISVNTSKVEGATSYQLVVSRTSNFAGPKYASSKSGSKSVAVNKSKTYYYVKTRARRRVNGEYVYGPYSTVKKVKVK